MGKKITWNLGLLLLGILIVFAFSYNASNSYSVIPGGHSSSYSPIFGTWNKVKLGILIGVGLMLLRYIIISILSIQNKNTRLFLLMLGYSLPIFIAFIGLRYYSTPSFKSSFPEFIPINKIKNSIQDLRKVGMFKSQSEETDEFVTQLAIGRVIASQNGFLSANKFWNKKTNSIKIYEILKTDTDKVLYFIDAESRSIVGPNLFDFIKTLKKISENNFEPINIKIFEDENKIRTLSFDIKGKTHTFLSPPSTGKIDLNKLLQYINSKILEREDFKFYHINQKGILLIGLSKMERNALDKIEGIEFINAIDNE